MATKVKSKVYVDSLRDGGKSILIHNFSAGDYVVTKRQKKVVEETQSDLRRLREFNLLIGMYGCMANIPQEDFFFD